MVPSISPSVNQRAGFDTLFANTFSDARRHKVASFTSIDNAPNKACGDPINPTFSGLYIWSNSVNKLSLSNNLANLHELCRQFKENQIGIAAMQELNIDMTQASVYRKVKGVFDEHFSKQCIIICSTTSIRSATTWKPGSTLLVIMPKWTPYVVGRSRDDLGRWCSVTFQVKDQKQLVFYSFYNCCKTTIAQSGIHTIFAQQWHVLRQRGDKAPDPRLQAVNDLKNELSVHKKHQRSICIVGDFNEDIGYNPAVMASVCSEFDLVDTMDTVHPDEAATPSYARSSNRLDYILLSLDLLPSLMDVGLGYYHDFYPSDHRPIFVGLKTTLFGSLPSIVPPQFRYVDSNSKVDGKFVELVYQHLEDTGTFSRLDSLFSDDSSIKSDPEFITIANSIDDQITRGLLSAEHKCKKPQREPWSETVHFASLHVKYWRLKGAATRKNYDASETLAAILPLLPSTHAIKEDDTRTDRQHLNAAYRFLKRTRREAKTLRTKFLQELRERIANRKTPTDMVAKASLQCIEKQLCQTTRYRHIKHVLCPSTSSPLTKVNVTTTEKFIHPATGEITSHSAIEVIDTKEELEARILARNKKHFAQAQGTPFTEKRLLFMTPATDMTELCRRSPPSTSCPDLQRDHCCSCDPLRCLRRQATRN
jgi:hypothetical protein